jgi:hypothetical protein
MSTEQVTKEQKRMRAVVAKFQAYVATYTEQPSYDTYSDKTFLDDMLYGLGISLQIDTAADYTYASGFDRFKEKLREHIR